MLRALSEDQYCMKAGIPGYLLACGGYYTSLSVFSLKGFSILLVVHTTSKSGSKCLVFAIKGRDMKVRTCSISTAIWH